MDSKTNETTSDGALSAEHQAHMDALNAIVLDIKPSKRVKSQSFDCFHPAWRPMQGRR